MSIQNAKAAVRFLWPQFTWADGAVLIAEAIGKSTNIEKFDDLTSAEAFINHVHVLDVFTNSAEVDKEPFYDRTHPGFVAAIDIGRLAARLWAHKLALEFPESEFLVYFTRDDNPIVRFHMVRDGEPVWLEPTEDQIESGAIRIHSSRHALQAVAEPGLAPDGWRRR